MKIPASGYFVNDSLRLNFNKELPSMRSLFLTAHLFSCFFLFGQTEIEYYNKANAQVQYQNYSEAISLLTSALGLKPDYADAYALRGDCYYYTKAYDKAISDYEKDLTLKKNRSAYNLACSYALSGKKDAAFKALEANLGSEYKLRMSHVTQDADLESLKADPRWESLIKKKWYTPYEDLINEADVKVVNNDPGTALTLLTNAIELEPTNPKGYARRALVNLRSENISGALEDLDMAIKYDPQRSEYYGNRGYVNNQLRNSKEALADYEKAIKLDPSNLVYYDLGIARYMNGDKAGALDAIRKHIDYFGRDELGYYFGGIIASETELFNEAIRYFNKGISINEKMPEFYMKRGDVYFIMKQYQDAVTDYSKVIELDGSNGGAYYIRGNAKASLMDKSGACEDWKKAESLGFEDSNGYIRDLCN
jgi:tetratricopeptide (TPR) repeat protein